MDQQPDKKPRASFSVDDIGPPEAPVSPTPDPSTTLGLERYEHERLEIQISHTRAELESFRQDVSQRRQYAPKIFSLDVVFVLQRIASFVDALRRV